ncbi:hypothetical protein V1264_010360 [Littorina saxatilis]
MDTGWSWAVMIGHFLILMIMVGYQKCNGILFVEIQRKFDVTASVTSMVSGVSAACYSVVAVCVMTCVINVISERQCVLIGAALMTSAQIGSTFATSFPVFVITLGAIQGVGASFIYGPAFVILGKYFSRRLTLAQAFVTSGVSVGGVVVPLLVRFALDEYSFPSGMLIVGGIIANIFVCGSLFRPVPAEKRNVNLLAIEQDMQHDQKSGDGVDKKVSKIDVQRKTSVLNGTSNEEPNGTRLPCSGAETTHKDEDDRSQSALEFSRNENGSMPLLTINTEGLSLETQTHETKQTEAQLYDLSDIETVLVKEIDPKHITEKLLCQDALRPRTMSESGTFRTHARNSTNPLTSSLQNMFPGGKRTRSSSDAPEKAESFLDALSSSNILAFSSVPELMCVSVTALGTSQCNLYSSDDNSFRGSHDARGGGDFSPRKKSGCLNCGKVFDLSICKSLLFWGMVCMQATGFLTGALAPAFLPPLAKEKGLTDREATHLLTVIGGLDVISRLLSGVIAHYKLMKPQTMVIVTLFVLGLSCQFVRFLDTFAAMMVFCAVFGSLSGVFFSMTPAVVIHFMGLERFATAFGFIQLFNGMASAVTYPLLGALKDKTGTYTASYHYLGATALFAAGLLTSLPLWGRVPRGPESRNGKSSDEHQVDLEIPLRGATNGHTKR